MSASSGTNISGQSRTYSANSCTLNGSRAVSSSTSSGMAQPYRSRSGRQPSIRARTAAQPGVRRKSEMWRVARLGACAVMSATAGATLLDKMWQVSMCRCHSRGRFTLGGLREAASGSSGTTICVRLKLSIRSVKCVCDAFEDATEKCGAYDDYADGTCTA